MSENNPPKVALLILDGWGINHNPAVSAIEAASTPFMDSLIKTYPNNVLTTFGEKVGLPEGQMGNSEVGHMNIGAGRIVYQELVRINKAFAEKQVEGSLIYKDSVTFAEDHTKRVHIMGLLSDGGVHSHISHLLSLCELFSKKPELEVFIHVFLDGRDTDPMSGIEYLRQLENKILGSQIKIASVIGRYYAMDRDNRWQRTKLAYDLIVHGKGKTVNSFTEELTHQYQLNITDEFMVPLKNNMFDEQQMNILPNDVVWFFNFRTDRPRQLTHVLTQQDKPEFEMSPLPLYMVTFSEYDKTFKNIKVLFEKDNLNQTLGEVLSHHNKTQLRIAETEKYPHVTFFFNGGREIPFNGEERIMVPSPKVATYDEKPEMSAPEISTRLIEYVKENTPDFICLNYANTDMVGHTGIFSAAVKATEVVDHCLSDVVPVLQQFGYEILIIADHGNSDVMVNEDGSPNTAHSMNPVPLIYIGTSDSKILSPGKLGDLAPTILHLMKLPIPTVMNGNILLNY
ncbi:MAG: 2,3-bisphosphoglycerate-independent phosphoglycerate mutase [Saprospiraceae bacterium]|nr:2,3-bisphosphoglycerate-independent phosphoglycerate mutase [Saprospiraceae bacterium]